MSEWKEVNSSTDETWDKKAPIEGKLVDKKSDVGPNNSKMYVLEVGTKRIGVWGSTVIDTKMAEVMTGSTVRIEALGEVTGKSGKTYQDFKIMYKPSELEEVFGKENLSEQE